MHNYKKIAFLFPGQGSQYPGMGKDFIDIFPIAKHTLEEADDALGRKLSKIILEGPEDLLTETKNSQTGIYVISMAILRVINEQFPEISPFACAGLSLGEYTALTASQRCTFSDVLPIVQARGQYMNEACEETKGGMAVILGLNGDVVEQMVKEVNMPDDLWAANFNCPGQVVISGTTKGIEAGKTAALAKGAKRVLPLTVHGAFHSGLMALAEERLADHILRAPLRESEIHLIMNTTGSSVKELSAIRHNLIKQVTSPVRWEQGMRFMMQEGIDFSIEMGCGRTLAGFHKRIGIATPCVSIEKVADLKELETWKMT